MHCWRRRSLQREGKSSQPLKSPNFNIKLSTPFSTYPYVCCGLCGDSKWVSPLRKPSGTISSTGVWINAGLSTYHPHSGRVIFWRFFQDLTPFLGPRQAFSTTPHSHQHHTIFINVNGRVEMRERRGRIDPDR